MIKLLIADDEPLVQIGLKSMLNWQDYDIEICATAVNGAQALELIEHHSPDIVITDIRMPVMDGFTATKKIRSLKRPDSLSVPIVALSANALQEDIKYAEDVGMTAYLTKPIELEALHRKLNEYMT